jgi:hypothetical protein
VRGQFPLLLVALLAAACDRPRTGRAPASPEAEAVQKGKLRVRSIGPGEDWKAAWLSSEGWEFFGHEFEAGTAGTVEIRWSDARTGRPIASFSCEAYAGKPVRALYGLRASPPLEAETIVECPGCGSRRRLRGTWVPDEISCKKCDTTVPVNMDWQSQPTRDLRLLLRGDCRGVKAGDGLKLRGTTYNTDSGNTAYLFGEIRAREVTRGVGIYCDPVDIQRRGEAVFGGGEHELSVRIHLPTGGDGGSSTSWESDRLEFSRTAGQVEVTGTEKGYKILVGGRETPAGEYPHPIWKFTVRYTPQP